MRKKIIRLTDQQYKVVEDLISHKAEVLKCFNSNGSISYKVSRIRTDSWRYSFAPCFFANTPVLKNLIKKEVVILVGVDVCYTKWSCKYTRWTTHKRCLLTKELRIQIALGTCGPILAFVYQLPKRRRKRTFHANN